MKSKSKLQYNLILKYLKTVTSLNEVKTKLIGFPEIDSIVPFFQSFERNIQNKGVRDTIDLYKLLRRIGQCIALNTAFDPLPRRKVIRGTEIPVLLKELLPFLQGNSMSKRLGLTALNVVSTLRLPPSSDITAITDAGVELNPNLLNEFKSFVKRSKFLGRNKWIRKVNTNKPITGYFSSKNGPNGPSMRSCDLDAYALSRDPELNKSVEALIQIGGDPVIAQVFTEMSKATVGLSEHYEKLNPISAKISQIAEGGGKTRNIAIIDYWSQNALMFIHDHLMFILKKMKQDATYNQEDIFTLSRDYALKAGCCYSFDLSSATDRFPLALQTIIIEKMFGCEVMSLWRKVIVDLRVFKFNGSEVRWSVGQPLGALSSWATFALTHHLFIRWCANDHGFKDYCVLGDDVLIWDSKVAEEYKRKMDLFGVKINLKKSFVCTSPSNVFGEFAKRIFLNNEEITGLPFKLIESTQVSMYMIPEFLSFLRRRWSLTVDEFALQSPEFFPWLTTKGRSLLTIIMTFNSLLGAGEIRVPWLERETNPIALKQAFGRYLSDQYDKKFARLSESLRKRFASDGRIESNPLVFQFFRTMKAERGVHVARYVLGTIHEPMGHPIGLHLINIQSSFRNIGWDENRTLEEYLEMNSKFVPDLDMQSVFRDRKTVRAVARSKVILEFYYQLKETNKA